MQDSTSEATLRFSRRSFISFTAGAAVLVTGGGKLGIPTAAAQSSSGSSAFLDSGVVHQISVTFDQAIYQAMIDAYVANGDKEWIEAFVSIDGTAYEKVGMRLKGNSSLMGLRGNNAGGGPQFQIDPSTGGTPTAGEPENRIAMGDAGGSISADEPQGLPWLVRLDKYLDAQTHNGLPELVMRSNNSATSLNEAVALELLAKAGLASQLAASTGFSVNGSDPALRLAIEHPNNSWMERNFSADGLLFKSESTGDWSYRGEEPASYDEIFDLEAGDTLDDAADFKPLARFLDFINNSDDAAFVSELPARLDVDRFSVYLSMMDLIENFDDIDGPGNNSYLFYDRATEQFTVVPWDMNLAFGNMMGGGRSGGSFPAGIEPPSMPGRGQDGVLVVIDGTPIAEGEFRTNGGPGGAGGPGGMSNPLVERFRAVPEFAAMIETKSTSLRTDLYDSGVAGEILSRWAAVLTGGATAMVDQETITSEAESIATFFSQNE